MHVYWTGLAADLWRSGDRSLEWLLRGAASGEVFAAGHAEPGNDFPVLLSTARAERVDGGYRFYGHKFFGSLTPVWTFLGVHAMDSSDPAAPKVVHAFVRRDDTGVHHQTHVGHARHARHAKRRHDPRRRVRSRSLCRRRLWSGRTVSTTAPTG